MLEELKKKFEGKYFKNKNETNFIFIQVVFIREVETEIETETKLHEEFFIGTVIQIEKRNDNITYVDMRKATFNLFLIFPEYTEISKTMWNMQVNMRVNNLLNN